MFRILVVKGFDVEQADGLIDDRFGSRQEFARRQPPLARRIKHHAVRHSATNLVLECDQREARRCETGVIR